MRIRIAAAVLILSLASCKKEEKGSSGEPKSDQPAPAAASKEAAPDKAEPVAPAPPSAAAAKPAAAAPGDTITFKMTVPAVGTSWSEEKTQEMSLTIDAGGKTMPMTGTKIEKKQVTVLAASADAVTKAKISYDVSEEEMMAGKSRKAPTPHDDKTYVLDATGGKLQVTVDGGGAPSAEEIAAIEDAEERFGKPDKMSKLIDGMTFEKGKTVELPADQISDLMGTDEEMKVNKMTLTYTGVSGSDPVFDMVLGMGGEKDGMKIEIDVKGTATVDLATGELLAMTLEGPITMSGKAKATGTMKMSGTRTRAK